MILTLSTHVHENTQSIFMKMKIWYLSLSIIPRLCIGLLLTLIPVVAMAWKAPAVGDFGYQIYDVAINKVAKGPIGFAGGAFLIAAGATKMNESWPKALGLVLAGSCLIKVEELTTSLGALIN
ncbi:conjugative transfer protein TraE [Xenorhabdus bovienii]|uniref:conjugative transfer protein TraE n=1 Tax=Xenorhabdus bovienii TaxID=40576 RepID=UPI0023B348A2|nr:conjugative transfer protein TraE [Xenorhabdus bovienii]MDE9429893.1 conjugative transfer protein TraE [Xenorhabdus bovienii]